MVTLETFSDINNDIRGIRREVFIDEQDISEEEEFEGGEENFIHLCAYQKSILTGYLRIFVKESSLHIGRVAVKKQFRKQGIGRLLMLYAEKLGREKNCKFAVLNAQIQAKGFYTSLGYCADGDTFSEAGIEHIRMMKEL